MLVFVNDATKEQFEDAEKKSVKLELSDTWNRCVEQLKRIAKNCGGHVRVSPDFAPLSFSWAVISKDGVCTLNGGMIFHGAHDGGGNGGAPTYCVSLDPSAGWQLHT